MGRKGHGLGRTVPGSTSKVQGFCFGEGAAELLLFLCPTWLINNKLISDAGWAITQWRCCPSLSGQPCPSRAGNVPVSPTADPQDFHRRRTRMPSLSKLLFCGKNCMQLPTLQHLYVSMFHKEEEMAHLAQNHKGHYLRSVFLPWAQERCSHVC